jgi:hypothetical protein
LKFPEVSLKPLSGPAGGEGAGLNEGALTETFLPVDHFESELSSEEISRLFRKGGGVIGVGLFFEGESFEAFIIVKVSKGFEKPCALLGQEVRSCLLDEHLTKAF